MIIDLAHFVDTERPYWEELEALLDGLGRDPAAGMTVEDAKRLHYLYQRASADLAKLATFAAEPQLHRYLENLVARTYAEVHEVRAGARFAPWRWVAKDFPQAFRRQFWAFKLSVVITLAGVLFGGGAILLDSKAKEVLMPFPHLMMDPSERVEREETVTEEDPRRFGKFMGTSFYFTHNTRVAITTMAMGISWGIGTVAVLFGNGVMLGAVTLDYISAGESVFLVGWLLPHGAVEIPAILLAGQAGLVLGRALIGWGARLGVRARLRRVTHDLAALIFGVALMLAWAGFVEAFLSQYHEPVIPYWVKIAFGVVELVALTVFLARAGKTDMEDAEREERVARDEAARVETHP